MRKVIFLFFALLLVIPAVSAGIISDEYKTRSEGVARLNDYAFDPRIVYKKLDVWVYLTPPQPPTFARGYPPYYPRGAAKVQSVRSAYKPTGEVLLAAKDLRPSWQDNTYYQAWLYDLSTGAYLNLGQFEANQGGYGDLRYTGQHYFDAYDYLIVTREKRNDPDPRPSNDEVLQGMIVQKQFYEPKPVLGSRSIYGYTYYGE
jgi:hypothetical protein